MGLPRRDSPVAFRVPCGKERHQETGEEETDVCKALEDIKKHEMKKGMKKGVKQGERLGTLKTLCALVNDGLLKLEEAARRAGLSEEAFGREMKKAGY